MMRPDALWVKGVSVAPVAHLLMPNGGATRDRRSWCGASTQNSEPAPYLTRCQSCVAYAQSYVTSATEPVPARVHTTLVVRIEHGTDETQDSVCATALRRIAPGRNPRWRVSGHIKAHGVVLPEEATP